MKITKTKIAGVVLIEPQVFGDERGYFFEPFNKRKLEEALGHAVDFVQDNESRSVGNVLRGFAYQAPPFTQSKLVRVTEGKVLDIALDIRTDSPTYGQYVMHELSAENKHQVFMPKGIAHAFVTLSDYATFQYKVDNYFAPDSEMGVIYNDPEIGIEWPQGLTLDGVKVSDKDLSRPVLKLAQKFTKEEFERG